MLKGFFNPEDKKENPAIVQSNAEIIKLKKEIVELRKQKDDILAGNSELLKTLTAQANKLVADAEKMLKDANEKDALAQKKLDEAIIKEKEHSDDKAVFMSSVDMHDLKMKNEKEKLVAFEKSLLDLQDRLQADGVRLFKKVDAVSLREDAVTKREKDVDALALTVDKMIADAKAKTDEANGHAYVVEELNRQADKQLKFLADKANELDEKEKNLVDRELSLSMDLERLNNDKDKLREDILSNKAVEAEINARLANAKNLEISLVADKEKLENIKKALLKENLK